MAETVNKRKRKAVKIEKSDDYGNSNSSGPKKKTIADVADTADIKAPATSNQHRKELKKVMLIYLLYDRINRGDISATGLILATSLISS